MKKVKDGKVSTNWIVFLLVALVCVMVAGAVLLRGKVGDGGSGGHDGNGGVLTASTGWGTTHFSNLSAADVEATDDLTVGDDAAIGDDLTVAGDSVISGYMRLSSGAAISITNGCTITPTCTYQPLESAGTVGCGDIVTGTAGDRLVLINTSNTSITISDTGSLKLGANRALAQYDSLELWSDGTYWIELGYAENAAGTTTFSNLATTDLAVADDLTVTDDASVGGDLTVGDAMGVTGLVQYVCSGGMLLTDGGIITPTQSYHEIYAESAVTVTMAAAGPYFQGMVLFIENMATDVIIIQDTGSAAMAGDATLGWTDTLLFMFDGAKWCEVSRSNN